MVSPSLRRGGRGCNASRTTERDVAAISTITKLKPEMPIHANSGENGLSDWESATLPHAKPPYGHTLAQASRAVQSPATATGSRIQRPNRVGNARGTHRYANAIADAPSPKNNDSRNDSAVIGSGPRKSDAHSICVR